jgi:hypothetical protein
MSMSFDLEKFIWDDNDFEQMGWHDSKIYGIAFKDDKFELMLDIDYILEWLHPKENESNFKFWVAPATLVFRNVWDLKLSLEGNLSLEIQDIHRANPRPPKNSKHIEEPFEYDWIIETNNGEITFQSVGYKQYFRMAPILSDLQKIDSPLRGNSFDIREE